MVQYEPAAVRLLVQMMDPDFVCTVSVPCCVRPVPPRGVPCLFSPLSLFPLFPCRKSELVTRPWVQSPAPGDRDTGVPAWPLPSSAM